MIKCIYTCYNEVCVIVENASLRVQGECVREGAAHRRGPVAAAEQHVTWLWSATDHSQEEKPCNNVNVFLIQRLRHGACDET